MMSLWGESPIHQIIQMKCVIPISASIPQQLSCPVSSDLVGFFGDFHRLMTKPTIDGEIPNLSSSSANFSVS